MRARASSVTATIVAIAVAALAAVIPTAVAAPAVKGSLQLSDSTVLPSSPVSLSGSLPPRRSRTVKLQTKISGSWATLATKKSSAVGAFSFTATSPSAAGTRQYRVLAPVATLGGKRFAAVVTPTRTLTVVAVTAVDAGWHHACAVGSDHRAWCWGSNTYGELGDGQGATFDEEIISGPVQVEGGNWADISTMGGSTCGLKRDATAWCWGDHAAYTTGEIDGKAPEPVQIPGAWNQVASGWFHVCGVTTDAKGWCWGRNDGQLGTDQPVTDGTKVQLPGTWRAIVPGGYGNNDAVTCGIDEDRSAWCWGDNTYGQLGDGSTDASAVPVEVAGDHEWAQLSVGAQHTCGVTTDGAGWCWGDNVAGRLGDGSFIERHSPTRVTMADTWSVIDAGFLHTCGVTTLKAGWCWGTNDDGQLGNGTTTTTYFPDPAPHQLGGTWRDVAAGWKSSVGARQPGKPWAWGLGDYGQTGSGETGVATSPVAVPVNP